MAQKKKVPIRYTDRDFTSIKESLIEYAKRYYPSVYKNFNEASFGSLMMDMTAYIGDINSFYIDYQASESFLDSAIEYNNIIRHGRRSGYKFRGNPSSYGTETFYIIVPSNATGLGPDENYLPVLRKGSEVASTSGNGFILNENVDFSLSQNEVVVATVDDDTGIPSSYAIKAHGQIISGELVEELVTVSDFQEFLKIELAGESVAEILSVVDSEGHEYFEVDFLSQNVIYKAIINTGADKATAPAILKPIIVPRRFVVEQEEEITYLQFGFGSQEEIKLSSIADPTSVVLRLHGKDYTTDESFDPNKLLSTDKFGVAPSNTTLRIVYRKNVVDAVNAGADSITEVVSTNFRFNDAVNLDNDKMTNVITSLEVTNDESVVGDVSLPSTNELKRRIGDTFATQNRAVTAQDYISSVYQMPPQFGAIKRCKVIQDSDSFKRNLNLYVISEATDGTFTETNATIKKNLRQWLTTKKMINDTIDILDGSIVNVGIEFKILAEDESDRYSVLAEALERLQEFYTEKFDIGEPMSISKIYSVLNDVEGLADTIFVRVVQKIGGNYSDTRFDLDSNTSPDGRYIVVPENVVLEIKYSATDIIGSVS